MSSPDPEWWDVRAAEYVLGTLEAKERELFGRILPHDSDLQRSVAAWEERLAPLSADTPSRAPPERVWEAIARGVRAGADEAPDARTPDARTPGARTPDVRTPDDRIPDARMPDARMPDARMPDETDDRSAPVASPVASPGAVTDIGVAARRTPSRSGSLVPFVAVFATAASLVLGVLLHRQHDRLDALEASIVRAEGIGVILGEDGAPLWLVQTDFGGERVRVTALAPPPDGGGDYQLWQVLPDDGGVAAVSLLPAEDGATSETSVPGLVRRFDAFAVSLEPAGGSPEPVPTGAVLYRGGVTLVDDGDGA